MALTIVARRSGSAISSASRRAMYSPDAMARPALRADAAPPRPFPRRINLIRASDVARDSAIEYVVSSDPSSTTMISRSCSVCLRSESIASPTNSALLYAGMITETMGMEGGANIPVAPDNNKKRTHMIAVHAVGTLDTYGADAATGKGFAHRRHCSEQRVCPCLSIEPAARPDGKSQPVPFCNATQPSTHTVRL